MPSRAVRWRAWGYEDNLGSTPPSTPGPTAIAYTGEAIEFTVRNDLPEPTTVHSMHLHGADMVIVSQNGHPQPPQTVTTVDLGPGNFIEVELTFDKPGKWTFHCHFPHHTGNDGQSGPQGSPVGMARVFNVTA